MRIIKLSTTTSTNDYLKQLNLANKQPNFTTVWSLAQTHGKGQRGTIWIDEPGNSLTFSVLVSDVKIPTAQLFDFNILVAIAVYDALRALKIPDLAIKWPNDILSANGKIGGILIENSLKSTHFDSIVGIGINVNQLHFADNPQARSLRMITGQEWDLEIVLQTILQHLETGITHWEANLPQLWNRYYAALYRYQQWATFELKSGEVMEAKISAVLPTGLLELEDVSGERYTYELKQVRMVY